ncbi:MAG: type II CAAX endopeptidase family protein [Propioniciclava sp.]|uniref:CPBP family intramembrane glutamic endopeptidase n=1 Tax=Propioniciclava sp. TaxID=2038686 RepID=UPI0039E3E22A
MSAARKRSRSGNPAAAASVRPSADAARGPASWIDRFATERVPVGVDYPHVLRTPSANPALSVFGVLMGVTLFMLLLPLIAQLLAGVYWLAVGRPGEFRDTFLALRGYELPFGFVVTHLGLAVLIPLSWALVLFVHRVRPGYLSSVTGRLRWRWLGISTAVGFGALWLVLIVQNLTSPGGPSWALTPQPGAWAFLAVMLLTTPLQAAAEEYFFRGYLMQALGSLVRTPWFGIIASAAVFTAFHPSTNLAIVVDRFAFGVLAGWLVVRTGGLEAGIGAHIANNVSAFGLAALTSSVAELKAITEVTWAGAAWDIGRFALFTVLIWLLARGYRPQVQTGRTPRTAASV